MIFKMSYERAEIEYNKLLLDNSILRELVEHPKFRRQFIDLYNIYTGYGQRNIKIDLEYNKFNNTIVMRLYGEYPNDTNGIYQGVKESDVCTIGLEQSINGPRLCVRTDNRSLYRMPNERFDSLSHSQTLSVFNDYEQEGKIYYQGENKANFSQDPRAAFISPIKMSVNTAISGDIPFLPNKESMGDFSIVSVGGRNGGLVNRNYLLKNDNNYISRMEYVPLEMEHPESLENLGLGCIAYYDHESHQYMLPQGSEFTSVNEALECYRNLSTTYNKSK